jgi:hypothetical protein
MKSQYTQNIYNTEYGLCQNLFDRIKDAAACLTGKQLL